MKYQRKHRLPAGHAVLIEVERNRKAALAAMARPPFDKKPNHDLAREAHPQFPIGVWRGKSRKPVSLAKKA